MKLRKRTILAVALVITTCTGAANADKRHKVAAVKSVAPVVPLPADAPRVIPTPLGGPIVTLPVREGIDVAKTPSATPVAMSTQTATAPAARPAPAAAPKVVLPAGSDVAPVHTTEAGPLVPASK